MYANSLLVTLNSRRIVSSGVGLNQTTDISYTVPLSRIVPNQPPLVDTKTGNLHTDSDTIGGSRIAAAIDLEMSHKRGLDDGSDSLN